MKILEIVLFGLGAYLLLSKKGSAVADLSGGGGFIPMTTIPTSSGYQAKMESAGSPTAVITAAKAPISGIKVTAAPLATNSTAVKSEVSSIFQKSFIQGNFVPSSALSGQLTKTDIIIAGNIAKKSFK